MRQTPVNDYLEDISTKLPEEIYGCLSDAIYETVCEFDEEATRLKAENAKLRELCTDMWFWGYEGHMDSKSQEWQMKHIDGVLERMRELGVEVDG